MQLAARASGCPSVAGVRCALDLVTRSSVRARTAPCFGGLKITANAEVVDTEGAVMPGLFACGELVGGVFYLNYPGGAGLTNGAVFGRIAGRQAGQFAAEQAPPVDFGLPTRWRDSEVRVSGSAAD